MFQIIFWLTTRYIHIFRNISGLHWISITYLKNVGKLWLHVKANVATNLQPYLSNILYLPKEWVRCNVATKFQLKTIFLWQDIQNGVIFFVLEIAFVATKKQPSSWIFLAPFGFIDRCSHIFYNIHRFQRRSIAYLKMVGKMWLHIKSNVATNLQPYLSKKVCLKKEWVRCNVASKFQPKMKPL